MNRTTPLMDARKIMPASYANALYMMFKGMAGSATTLQDDVSGIIHTPNGTFEINSNKSFNCNDAPAVTLTAPAAYQQIAADDDMITMVVCKVPAPTSFSSFGVGSVTQGISNRFTDSSGTTYPALDDGTNAQIILDEVVTTPVITPDQFVLSAVAWDRSVGGEHYMYNLATATVLRDYAEASVANAVFTPTAVLRFTNMSDVLLAAIFRFTGAGLPSAWKADILAVAKAVVSEKG